MFTIGWLETQGASFTPKSPIAERGMAMAQGDVFTDSTDGRIAGAHAAGVEDPMSCRPAA